jgi:hypothetical protein
MRTHGPVSKNEVKKHGLAHAFLLSATLKKSLSESLQNFYRQASKFWVE